MNESEAVGLSRSGTERFSGSETVGFSRSGAGYFSRSGTGLGCKLLSKRGGSMDPLRESGGGLLWEGAGQSEECVLARLNHWILLSCSCLKRWVAVGSVHITVDCCVSSSHEAHCGT